jgi:hypothetical protein
MSFNELFRTQMMMSMGNQPNALRNLLALNVFDIVVKTFPQWSGWIRPVCCRRSKAKTNRTARASITCERGIPNATNQRQGPQTATEYASRMDAVVHYVTTLPAMKSLLAVTHHDYLPNEFESVCLDQDVFFELLDLKVQDGQLEIVKFRLFCHDHDVQHLQSFIDNCNMDYERRMKNKLGTHRYFFDQMIQTKVRGTVQNPLPTTHLVYTKTKFVTNRNFENVFFEERNQVAHRTRFFLEHRDWYDRKGIPYTLGFMFHGPPGTGKTSTVKAIANEGRRHIINVQLSEIKTKQQLQHLFFNDQIVVHNGTNTETYTIPVSERLYVIEDIDAMGDTVLRREWKKPTMVVKEKTGDPFLDRNAEPEKDSIDLSFLLNLLDGTLEANGRILIITTNFPERIDRALIRPGRIDMIVNFKKCSRSIVQEMANSFFEAQVALPEEVALDGKWSPAEVNQILFRNFGNPEQAVQDLVEMTQADLYGFREEELSVPTAATS